MDSQDMAKQDVEQIETSGIVPISSPDLATLYLAGQAAMCSTPGTPPLASTSTSCGGRWVARTPCTRPNRR